MVYRFAAKMGIDDVYAGTKDKASCLRDIAQKYGLDLTHICFMGDVLNDIPAQELAGLAVAPSNANSAVKVKVHWIAEKSGGNGAVREVVDAVLGLKD